MTTSFQPNRKFPRATAALPLCLIAGLLFSFALVRVNSQNPPAAADKKAHGADGKHHHAAFLVKLRAEHQTKANDNAQNFDAKPPQFPSQQSSCD